MSLLGKFISSVEKTSESRAAATSHSKSAGPGVQLGEAILSALAECATYMNQTIKQASIEFEIRMGLITISNPDARTNTHTQRWSAQHSGAGIVTQFQGTTSFVSGVDVVTFHRLQDLLREEGFQPRFTNTLTYIDGNGNRREVDAVTKHELRLDNKSSVKSKEMGMGASAFDLRYSITVETPASSFGEAVITRSKARTSYTHPSHPWIVDFTVTSTTQAHLHTVGGDTSNEVELEMRDDVLKDWMARVTDLSKNGRTALQEMTQGLAKNLELLLQKCNPEMKAATQEEVQTCTDADVKRQISSLFMELGKNGSKTLWQDRFFIGAMPVSMSRQHIPHIQSGDFFITEKTDGVRYMLAVVQGLAGKLMAYLLNRNCDVFSMLGGQMIGDALGKGTVLDGELVYNMTYKKQVFIVFDVLSIDGVSQVHQNFEHRYETLRTVLNPRLKRLCDVTKLNLNTYTYITRKIFLRTHEIGSLFDNVRMQDGERVYYESYKRHHKTDGIIFQPNTPYFANDKLLKWKYLDTVTVDLEVSLDTASRVRLLCVGPEGVPIDCTTQHLLAKTDELRILADSALSGSAKVIVEVAYCPRWGCWSYRGLRPDKNNPNYVATVFGAYTELAEGISEHELQHRLTLMSGAGDTWEEEMARAVEQILTKKRRR